MRRLGGIWASLVSFDNLWLAWRKARRGKTRRDDVAIFELQLESELLRLQSELLRGEYQPAGYRLFTLYERKPRVIAVAPFRDRVVHHAVMNCIEAPLDRRFIFDSYACRVGKGTHAAVLRYQQWARRYAYVMKLDVQRYFPSIDHDILKSGLRRYLKDKRTLDVLDRIIDGSPQPDPALRVFISGDDLLTPLERRVGIPIGNLTSQFFANLYLNELDHWIKETLKVSCYLRYVDDLVFLGNDKNELRVWRDAVSDKMVRSLRLCLHPRKAQIMPVSVGVNVLGYHVWPEYRRLANQNGYRFRRRLRRMLLALERGDLDQDAVRCRIGAWLGHAAFADSEGLQQVLFGVVPRRYATLIPGFP